jgi:hypothetical protein
MIADKNGVELQVGDEIVVRGKIVAIPLDLEDNGKAILQVNWDEQVPLIDYVQSVSVEKVDGKPDSTS